jgi:IS5 family transposase
LSGRKKKKLKKPYKALFRLVEAILVWARDVADRLEPNKRKGNVEQFGANCSLVSDLRRFVELGTRVLDVAQRRILNGEKVPNDEKLFSIFEEHTELLIRGRAGKPIEYGHMVSFQQVKSKFITDYGVFEKRPVDYDLIDAAIRSHEKLFDAPPSVLAADKGYYESMDKIAELEENIEVVAIGKKGKRNAEQTERETSRAFKLGQKFRAGIEGTISFLKRCLLLRRCVNKGFTHYQATIGVTVFAHNLLVLARDSS